MDKNTEIHKSSLGYEGLMYNFCNFCKYLSSALTSDFVASFCQALQQITFLLFSFDTIDYVLLLLYSYCRNEMFMFMTVGWLTLLFIRKAPGSNLETIICYPESLSVFSQSFQDYGI